MTHCERVLESLSDGQPHSHHELYALHVVAHSRISDLRRQGYKIEQWRETGLVGDAVYFYRLVSSPEQTPQAQAHPVLGALALGAVTAAPVCSEDDSGQLTFEDVA